MQEPLIASKATHLLDTQSKESICVCACEGRKKFITSCYNNGYVKGNEIFSRKVTYAWSIIVKLY